MLNNMDSNVIVMLREFGSFGAILYCFVYVLPNAIAKILIMVEGSITRIHNRLDESLCTNATKVDIEQIKVLLKDHETESEKRLEKINEKLELICSGNGAGR